MAIRYRLHAICWFQNTLIISWKPRNWTRKSRAVCVDKIMQSKSTIFQKYARNQLKLPKMIHKIQCNLTHMTRDLLVSKYAQIQLKTSKLSRKISYIPCRQTQISQNPAFSNRKHVKNQLKPAKLVQKIPYSPTQTT